MGSLVGKLEQAEMAKASLKHPESLDAYSLYWRGLEIYWRFTPRNNAKARELFEKAIALDPHFARAYALLAETHYMDWQSGFASGKAQGVLSKGPGSGKQGRGPGSEGPWARFALGHVLLFGKKYKEAVTQYEEALKANPNSADLLAESAEPYLFGGQPEEGIRRVREAMRLNPYLSQLVRLVCRFWAIPRTRL